MSRLLRGWLGALVSALLVLFAHPQSRPYLAVLFTQVGPNPSFSETRWIPGNQAVLPRPTNRVTAGYWILVGAERLAHSQTVSRKDLKKLVAVADAGAREEPKNGFWQQSAAVFLDALGNREEALKRWRSVYRADSWNDWQGTRLALIAKSAEDRCGMRSSWQTFAAYPYRSDSYAKVVDRYARHLVAENSLSDKVGLEIRYETLLNGLLMRDGAGSVGAFKIGQGIIEMASYPSRMEPDPTKRALHTARYEFHNALMLAGMSEQAKSAVKAFDENDGYSYFFGSTDIEDRRRFLILSAALVAAVPSALLGISFTALLIWGCGGLLLRKPKLRAVFGLPYAPILGLVAGIALFASLHLALVAVAATAAFGFAAFAPGQERSKPSEDLGPFFRFMLVMIALALTILLGTLFVGYTSPGYHLLPQIGVANDYLGGSGALVGLAAISLGLLLLVAPTWALVRKLPTPWVLALAARDLGKGLFLGAASLCVLSAMASLYVDPKLYEHGEDILQKEPLYYY